jgi:ATP-dependent Clp protease ATP-binding subunit ClpC
MEFIAWYYGLGLKKLIGIWKNYVEFIWYNFSVANFIKTLFSAWRRDVSRVNVRGLHPLIFLQTLVENIFTRIIGAIIKIIMIFIALILELFVTVLGLFVFLLWVTVPLALLFSLGEIVASIIYGASILFIFWLITFVISISIIIISLKSFRAGERDYFSMSLERLSQEKWFPRVWRRMGVSREDISASILENQEELKVYLNSLDLTMEEFSKIVEWETRCQIRLEKNRQFWSREKLLSQIPIGKNWAFAYTVHLDKYSSDLSEGDYSEYRDAELIGKEKELEELQLILTRPTQNSVMLIGEPGVGRDTIIHTLAKKIRRNQASLTLAEQRILEISLKEVLSTVSLEEGEAVLHSLFREAAMAGNVVLVLRDIHEYLGSKEGLDISSILGDYLNHPSFRIIGTTTPSDFHAYVEKKDRLMKYCDSITISEMTKDETLYVMLYKLISIEKGEVVMTYQAIREIINMADRYINNSPFPEKALDMMEEVILSWSNNPMTSLIDKATVDNAVSSKIKVPLREVTKDEGEKLMDLENILHKRVVGQDMAISQIAETVRRARVGMAQKDKPLGSFLFLGPTGVGKTESAKALAESYFGDENRMIRLDMSEYQAPDAISRIIGSNDGREGLLVSKVKENPYALLLLDEIEKAYPDILNLFLQILDEGYITDVSGKKISFRNLIIIATSNAASDVIKESIEAGLVAKEIQDKVISHVIAKGIFRAELLNRFEGVIFFHPLMPQDVLQVTELLLARHAKRIKEQENVEITFDSDLAQSIATAAFDPLFGARAINRFIQDKVDNIIARKIISGEIKKGEMYAFRSEDIK